MVPLTLLGNNNENGPSDGTENRPHKTVADANAAVSNGGTIKIKESVSSETGTFGSGGKGVTIIVVSPGGTTIIGQQ